MKSEERARALAKALVSVGTAAGKRVVAVLTRMDAPLGRAIGNANETREAIDVLFGRGPDDLVECTMALGAEMLVMAGASPDLASARRRLDIAINDRSAARKLEEMIKAQGGDPHVVDDPRKLPEPPMTFDVHADHSGFVTGIDALELGLAAVSMGAGRTRADQAVDPAVGIYLVKKPGDRVSAGDVLATVGARSEANAQLDRIRAAFTIEDAAIEVPPLLVERFA
jgi:pyrimidine-nucleoside phosphorylase